MSLKLKNKGFTLIELMIVVAIIAILATIAIPAYNDYVIRAKRADAKTSISQVQLAQEKWRANNTSYTNLMSNLGYTGDTAQDSPDSHYKVTVTNATATTYTITAVPQGSQATKDTECANFVIDQDGNKTISGSGSATACWNK